MHRSDRDASGTAQAVLWGSVLLAWCCSIAVAALPGETFPGAQGWAACTPGGRGGRILRVTTLERDGPGSFAEAARAAGPRTIVFEVGGVIDLDRRSVRIAEPYVTIAGQTAPSPGITFIRGGLSIRTHDVILRHIRVRPGEAGAAKKSGWEVDGIATNAACDVGTVPLFRADASLPERDRCLLESRPFWPVGLNTLPAEAVKEHVLANAGARPWDRDAIDRRLIAEARAGAGRVIDSEQEVGGYPVVRPTHATFNPEAWDLDTMTKR